MRCLCNLLYLCVVIVYVFLPCSSTVEYKQHWCLASFRCSLVCCFLTIWNVPLFCFGPDMHVHNNLHLHVASARCSIKNCRPCFMQFKCVWHLASNLMQFESINFGEYNYNNYNYTLCNWHVVQSALYYESSNRPALRFWVTLICTKMSIAMSLFVQGWSLL